MKSNPRLLQFYFSRFSFFNGCNFCHRRPCWSSIINNTNELSKPLEISWNDYLSFVTKFTLQNIECIVISLLTEPFIRKIIRVPSRFAVKNLFDANQNYIFYSKNIQISRRIKFNNNFHKKTVLCYASSQHPPQRLRVASEQLGRLRFFDDTYRFQIFRCQVKTHLLIYTITDVTVDIHHLWTWKYNIKHIEMIFITFLLNIISGRINYRPSTKTLIRP